MNIEDLTRGLTSGNEDFPKTNIDYDNYTIMSLDEFYSLNNKVMAESVKKYHFNYFASASDICFYIKIDKKHKCVKYYGSSIEGDVQPRKGVTAMDFEEFSLESEKYNSNRIREDIKQRISRESEGLAAVEPIRRWLMTHDFNDLDKAIKSRVRGQEETSYLTAEVYNYLECIVDNRPINNNILLAAPSGCGKTEIFRALRDYFKTEVPELIISQVDVTQVTENGYKGENANYIVKSLQLQENNGGVGIIFIDEFDKKLVPSITGGGVDTNAAVQASLLTMIEGSIIPESRKGRETLYEIDTSRTMFIGMGAFDECRKKREDVKNLGFGASQEKIDHYNRITKQEILGLGCSNELLGRFSSVINFHKLTDEVIVEIIGMMRDKIAQSLGVEIVVGDNMIEELIKEANGTFGCRVLEGMIREKAMQSYIKILQSGENRRNSVIFIGNDEDTSEYIEKDAV